MLDQGKSAMPEKTIEQSAAISALALLSLPTGPTQRSRSADSKREIPVKFIPDKLEVAAGDTVTWANEDVVRHTATAKGQFDAATAAHFA